MHDPAAFVLHFHLLLRVAAIEEAIDVRQDVERDLVRVNSPRGLLPGGKRLDLPAQFLDGLRARCRTRPGSWPR